MTPPAAAAAPAVRRGRMPAQGRSLTTAPRPRRVSGPARRGLPARRLPPAAQADGGLALGLLAALRSVSRHRLLDRLIAGRTWIAVVAFALIGIVTLQLGLLKLNASIGHSLERQGLLQRENAALSIENSELAAGDRVESTAAGLGMELVPAGTLRFLAVRPQSDAARGAAALGTPVHSSGTSVGESTAGASSTAASSTPSSTPAEQTATPAAGAPPTSEARTTPPGEPRTTGESTPSTSTPPSATVAPSSATAGAAAGASPASSGESAPAGGTQARGTG